MKKMMMAGMMTLAALSANAQSLDKAAVEKIVQAYIQDHGDEIAQSLKAADERERLAVLKRLIGPNTPTKGPATAPVTIVEFSEFQCPFCGKVQPTVDELRKAYGDKVRWAFKNLPLEFHPMARPAAEAAMAAQLQGKYWAYAKDLWANQRSLSEEQLVASAKKAGLDMKKFEADRKSAKVKAMIDGDLKDAKTVGASGTPYFLINGKAVSGALPVDAFREVIDAELKGGK